MTPAGRLSVIVPVREERQRLPQILAMLEAQTLRPDEVVIADGMSHDGSRAWLDAAATSRPWLRVVDNPGRLVPAALNAAFRATSGQVVARMDAHADYPPDYLEHLVGFLHEHPRVGGVGAAMHTQGRGPWGTAIAATLRRPFGLGGARHRTGGAEGPIDHIFTGCYRRDALEAAGGWDERLSANEDYEADTRVRGTGHELWLYPTATTTWYVREDVPALIRQMLRYGHGKALTLLMHPSEVRARQLAPPALVLGLAGTLLVRPRVGGAALAAYLLGAAGAGAVAARTDGASAVRGAVVPAAVHLPWGLGLLMGLVRHAWKRPEPLRGGERPGG